jgi:phage gpG-like protein
VRVIIVRDEPSLIRLKGRVAHPEKLLRRFGALGVAASSRAFRDQRLGDKVWPERYPKQGPPKVNVAGVVSDLARGAEVKQRRFDARPAVFDTGALLRSLSFRTNGKDTTEIGSVLPYASIQNFGGLSRQAITPTVRTGLAKFLRSQRGKGYRERLGWLFSTNVLETKVHPRPFLGFTDELAKDLVEATEAYVAGG